LSPRNHHLDPDTGQYVKVVILQIFGLFPTRDFSLIRYSDFKHKQTSRSYVFPSRTVWNTQIRSVGRNPFRKILLMSGPTEPQYIPDMSCPSCRAWEILDDDLELGNQLCWHHEKERKDSWNKARVMVVLTREQLALAVDLTEYALDELKTQIGASGRDWATLNTQIGKAEVLAEVLRQVSENPILVEPKIDRNGQ
jgi:hypothetical protein